MTLEEAVGDGAIYPDGSEVGQPTYNAVSIHGIRPVYAAATWGDTRRDDHWIRAVLTEVN